MKTEKIVEGLALGVIITLTAAVIFLIATGCGEDSDWNMREPCSIVPTDDGCHFIFCEEEEIEICTLPPDLICTAIRLDGGVTVICEDGSQVYLPEMP